MKTGFAALSFLAALPRVSGEIHDYDALSLDTPYLYYHFGGQFSPRDAPAAYSPGEGRSFISFADLHFSRRDSGHTCPAYAEVNGSWTDNAEPCYNAKNRTLVQVIVLEQRYFKYLGRKSDNGETYYCCTPGALENGVCTAGEINRVILSLPEGTTGPPVLVADFHVASAEMVAVGEVPQASTSETRYSVEATGYYNLFVSSCDMQSGEVLVNGRTEWMNPFGYLPGTVWGKLPFFGSLAIIYLALGLVWVVLMCMHWKELMGIQSWISLVLVLGMVETAAQYFRFNSWNASGYHDATGAVFGLLMGAVKRAVSRVLVLMVSMGYGIVKPSLGTMLYKILFLGAAYFVFSFTLDICDLVPAGDTGVGESSWVFSSFKFVVTLLCAMVDVTFYMWIMQELTNTIEYLHQRRQAHKLRLFRRFRAVLILSVIFSFCWAIATLSLSPSQSKPWRHWRVRWALDAVWEVCYLIVLIAICALWRPSANMQRYAYSVQLGTGDEEYDEDTAMGIEMDKMDADDEEFGSPLEDVLPSANGPGVGSNKQS